MEWGTMSILDLVNLASQLTCTKKSPKRKTTKILNLHLQQMKFPKQSKKPSNFHYCKEPGHWEKRLLQIQAF